MYRPLILYTFLALIISAFTQNVYSVQIQDVQNDRIVYENWVSIQQKIQDSSDSDELFRNQVSESYLNFYEATKDTVYLNFALHEAVRAVSYTHLTLPTKRIV